MSKKEQTAFVLEDTPFDSEEANFFHTLASFEDLVREYGIEEVLVHINPEIYQELFDFFVPIEGDPDLEY